MHFRRSYILILPELALLLFCTQGIAWAQQPQQIQKPPWAPELVQLNGTRGPSDPLRIRLVRLPPNTLELLALELDGMDVTSMVTMEGDDAVFIPPQPLAYGKHQLRLVEYGKDGSINERGLWPLELRKSALFRDAQAQGNVIIKGGYRVSDHGITGAETTRSQADGAAQFSAATDDEDWRTSAALAVIANSHPQIMPRRKGHIDLEAYLLTADSGVFGVKAGDHMIGPDSLILQSFGRRGISVSATAPGKTAAITGFSMHTTPMTGAVNVFGVSDSANRVDGIVALAQPITGDAEALALMGTYVNGGNESQTSSVDIGSSGSSGGHASSIIADSNLLQSRLRLRGEYAKSAFDFDGRAGDLASLDGHAYSGLVTFLPWNDMVVYDQPLFWNMGLEKKFVSSYFRSSSNPDAISDRDMARIFTGINWHGLDVQINAGKESDNVDNNPLIPSTSSRQHSSTITYMPMANNAPQPNGQSTETSWYGQPSFNASFMSLKRELIQYGGISYSMLTHTTYNKVVGASFQYATWNWGLMQNWIRDRGYSIIDMTPHSRTSVTRLQGNFRYFEKLSVGMNAFSENVDAGVKTNGIGGSLNLAYPFTDKINSNLAYSSRHDWVANGSFDSVTSDTTAALNWIIAVPHGVRPGVTIEVDGSYRNVSNKSAASAISMYQVFLRLSLAWAPTY